uniref:Uncharacterized protein n=1 Tax=Brassica oleracea TaxID=3712 RepID=A0A3P6F6D7_BRAOL|nr:unnamed protein product [Brassica oleracea]
MDLRLNRGRSPTTHPSNGHTTPVAPFHLSSQRRSFDRLRLRQASYWRW